MSYNVSPEFRQILYSGESDYDCKLYINGERVPVEQISNIKISSPIIDTSNETGAMFHIGTFISQAITIKFKNLDGLDLTSNPEVYLEIGLFVDGAYEYVPIGYYMIDDLAENYQKTCEVTCLDYAVKFKPNLDISQFFEENGQIEAGNLFISICNYYGVVAGTYPLTNSNKIISSFDNTLSGKAHISYLAELMGGNAKMGRDGRCNIVPLKPENSEAVNIDASSSKSLQVGDKFEISRVCYDNGDFKFQSGGNVITVEELPVVTEKTDTTSYYYLTTELKYYKYNSETEEWEIATDIKNTLYLRTENMFISSQEDVDAIYEVVNGFAIQNITCENRADLSLDAWDVLKYTIDGIDYHTLNDNEINFNGTSMGKVITNVPTGTKAETTNILTASDSTRIKRIKTEIDLINNQMKTIITDTETLKTETGEQLQTLEQDFNLLQGSLGEYAQKDDIISVRTEMENIRTSTEEVLQFKKDVEVNGVTKVTTTTGYTFNENGLTIEKTGAETKSTLNEVGLSVKDATGTSDENLLFAGYDTTLGETIVKSKNMTVEKYLVIGKYSRIEDYLKNSVKGTGVFWIGG